MSQIPVQDHVHCTSSEWGLCQDISQLQDRLKETERLARMGHWQLDLDTDQLYWSDEVYRIFEIEPTAFTGCYAGFLEQVHPDDRQRVDQAFNAAVHARQPYEVVHRLRLRDGRIKYVKELGQAICDEQGRVERAVGMVQDITEQMQTLASLQRRQETEQTLQRILAFALEPMPLEEKLERALHTLYRISWLNIEHRGAVFLMAPDGGSLQLCSANNLNPELRRICAEVPLGHCLCGQAAQRREVIFKACLDSDHHFSYAGISDHGHYITPILDEDRLLGVLNLYTCAGHDYSEEEADFFKAVAQVLASIIRQHQLDEERDYLSRMLAASPDPMVLTDSAGCVRLFNQSAVQLFPELRAGGCFSLAALGVQGLDDDSIRLHARTHGSWSGELLLPGPASVQSAQLVTLLYRAEPPRLAGYAYLFKDISDRKALEEAARQMALSEQHFSNALIDALPGLFLLLDDVGRILRCNNSLALWVGRPIEQLLQQPVAHLLQDPASVGNVETLCRRGGAGEIQLTGADGEPRDLRLNCVSIRDATGKPLHLVTGIDISDSKRLQRQLAQQAKIDSLTGAYNRRSFSDRLEQAVRRSQRYGQGFAVILFDIDDFKRINDAHGHQVGDQVLCALVQRTRAVLRESDLLARWGGEEFIVLSLYADRAAAQCLAERMRMALTAHPVGPVAHLSASFGLACYRADDSLEQLIQRADQRLYRAKRLGKDRVVSG